MFNTNGHLFNLSKHLSNFKNIFHKQFPMRLCENAQKNHSEHNSSQIPYATESSNIVKCTICGCSEYTFVSMAGL